MHKTKKNILFKKSFLKYFSFFLFLLYLSFMSLALQAQVSINTDISDPVYEDIDKLIAQGLIKKIIVSQKPFSRKEIARITIEARKNFEKNLKDSAEKFSEKRKQFIEESLESLEENVAEEISYLQHQDQPNFSFHPLEQSTLDTLIAKSHPSQIKVDNGIGQIRAQVNPLLDHQEGRHYVSGANLALESSHWFRASPYFAFKVSPRFQLGLAQEGSEDDKKVYIQNLYAKLNFKNVEIEAGRDSLFWGMGHHSSLLLSQNARPLDLIKISNDSPIILPSIFKYLGPAKFSFFYADLGPEQIFPHSYFAGHKMSFQPTTFFEWSFSLIDHSGGTGSPAAKFSDRLLTSLPVASLVIYPFKDIQTSNRIAGLDFKLRIPPLRGTEIYSEVQFDDIDLGRIGSMFWEDGGIIAGAYIPRLDDAGQFSARFEYHHTGLRYYRHGQFISGWTENNRIAGDDLGPQAQGLYSTFTWDPNSENRLNFNFSFEKRYSDNWTVISDPKWTFVKTADLTDESRYQSSLEWLFRPKKSWFNIATKLAYERVQNFNFVEHQNKNFFLGQIKLIFNWDRWTKKTLH